MEVKRYREGESRSSTLSRSGQSSQPVIQRARSSQPLLPQPEPVRVVYEIRHSPAAYEQEEQPVPRRRRSRFPVFALLLVLVFAGAAVGSGAVKIEISNASKSNAIANSSFQPEKPIPNNYADLGIVQSAPSIGPDKIDQILQSYGSPATGTGQVWYDLGLKYNIDPAYAIAFFIHESSAGTNPAWAGWKDYNSGANTHNVGNIICAGYSTCFGRFRDYPNWDTGIEDWYRLIAVEYIDGRGAVTVAQIIPIYAPSFENDVQAYVSAVERLVDGWRKEDQSSSQSSLKIELWPDASVCTDTRIHGGAFDWCAPQGTPVHAPWAGTFLEQGFYGDELRFGAYMTFLRDDGLEVYVGHLDQGTVNPHGWKRGDQVEAGQQLGQLGPFPHSEPHTHVQFRRNGVLIQDSDQWWVEFGLVIKPLAQTG